MEVLARGSLLGGCRIDAVIGHGGMGLVYRARQLELDRDVALKVIAAHLVEDEPSRRRFLKEARAAGAVEHPNVVPVHGAGIAEGRAYLVMRYVAGDDLRTLVRREGMLHPSQAVRIAGQLGDALDAIHRAGYVHRDVKPQNVMVDDTQNVYLTDFGLAKHALSSAGLTRSDEWVGTLDYVAPEQIRGQPVDARTDVYAFGGVLYFMLTGRAPFEAKPDHAKLWAHLADPPPRPSALRSGIPPELDAVVQRALAKDPARRQPSAGDLAYAAREAARGRRSARPERKVANRDPAQDTTAAARSGVVAAARGRPRRAFAVLALAVAAAVTAVLLLTASGRDPRRESAGRTPAPTTAAGSPEPSGPAVVGAEFHDVGFSPRGVAVVGDRVWVISYRGTRIAALDAQSGERLGPQPLIGRGATSIAADRDTVWVTLPPRGYVVGIGPESGSPIRRITTPLPPFRVAVGRSGLWIAARETAEGPAVLLHYDRSGGTLLHQLDFPAGISALALGGGYAWVALAQASRIVRVSPDGAIEQGANLVAPAAALSYGAGHLWASALGDDSIARIDPRSKVAVTTAAGRHPVQLAVARGHVYVASNTNHRVLVLDAETGKRSAPPLRVAPNPFAVAAGGGHVWVTSVGTGTLTRLDLGA